MQITKEEIRELLEEAFYEVLSEQELKTASQEILGKFPTLKRQLIALFTAEYEEFVEPHGYKSMPLYANKQWVKPLTNGEINEYNKER